MDPLTLAIIGTFSSIALIAALVVKARRLFPDDRIADGDWPFVPGGLCDGDCCRGRLSDDEIDHGEAR